MIRFAKAHRTALWLVAMAVVLAALLSSTLPAEIEGTASFQAGISYQASQSFPPGPTRESFYLRITHSGIDSGVYTYTVTSNATEGKPSAFTQTVTISQRSSFLFLMPFHALPSGVVSFHVLVYKGSSPSQSSLVFEQNVAS